MSTHASQVVIVQPISEDCSYLSGGAKPETEIERIRLLNNLAHEFKDDRGFDQKLHHAAEKARILTQADVSLICLSEKTGDDHLVKARSGDIEIAQSHFKFSRGGAFSADPSAVPGNNLCFLIDLASRHPEHAGFVDQFKKYGINAGIVVPLQVKTHHLGFLFVGNRKHVDFPPVEQCLLSLMGNLLAAEIDRKRTEEEHLRFETILEQAVESILITDREGFVMYVNPYFEINSGYLRQEILGHRPAMLQSGIHDREFYRRMWETLSDGNSWRGHIVNKRKDGSLYELDAVISPIRNNDGEITHYVSVRKDVTQETTLRRQLYQAQKMEAIGTLAGGIAHDFNNLMMGIQGNVSLMGLEMGPKDPNRKRCETIESYIKKGSDLTMQLLGIAQSGKYQQVATDIAALVTSNLNLFGRTKKEICIHNVSGGEGCIAEVDAGQIEQVLLNLFVNAWQAMPEGGDLLVQTDRITVSTTNSDVVGLKTGSYVRITVTDTGVGMDKTVMERIFDPFFTTKKKSRGTGLGLASAYGIIKNHEGAIKVRSEKGKGTTFEVLLPASDKQVPLSKPEQGGIQSGRETILLVDDEVMILEICSEILGRLGYRVIAAQDGETALSILREQGDDIALVILDLVMPVMSGREIYDRMTAYRPDIKVLLASGYALDTHARELMDRGAIGFIQKPYSVANMSQKVREAIDSP